MRPQSRHHQIRRQIKHDIAHVEQCQARGDLVRRGVQDRAEVVALRLVHGLRKADVGADGGAEEVEDPERGDYAVVEFSFVLVSLVCYASCYLGCSVMGGEGRVPVDALDAGDIGFGAIGIVAGFKDSRVLFLSVFTGDIYDVCPCRVRGHVLVLCTLQRSQRTTSSIQLSDNSQFQTKSTRHKPQK